jgi:hypothetical protein
MPLQRSPHLFTVAIIRIHEVGTDEQQYDLGGIQVFTNFPFPLRSSANITIVPKFNKPLSLQGFQVFFEFLQKSFVFMSVAEEDFNRHERVLRLFS